MDDTALRSSPKHPVTPLMRSLLARSLKPMMQISQNPSLHTPYPCPVANCMSYKNLMKSFADFTPGSNKAI